MAFDDITDQLTAMLTDVGTAGAGVRVERSGSFGTLTAEVATPLAMVIAELLQNAVEHGCGVVQIAADRTAERLRVEVRDDGVGLPADFDLSGSDRLGLQIVRTLVETELGGALSLERGAQGGTTAIVDLAVGG